MLKLKHHLALITFIIVFAGTIAGCTVIINPSDTSINTTVSTENIKVSAPLQNDVVNSPLKVSGEAKGSWFFEGSFPISLKDSDGNIL